MWKHLRGVVGGELDQLGEGTLRHRLTAHFKLINRSAVWREDLLEEATFGFPPEDAWLFISIWEMSQMPA